MEVQLLLVGLVRYLFNLLRYMKNGTTGVTIGYH